MYDKLNKGVFIPKGKTPKNVDGDYNKVNLFNEVQQEFEAISGIVATAATWVETEEVVEENDAS